MITGNWIRIRETFTRFPVPLARGAGHLNIKREMIEVADEVYVISPLGKIFVGHEKHKVNSLLKSIADDRNTAYKHSYKELNTNKMHLFKSESDGDVNSEKIKLITTGRPKASLLYESSERIFEYLKASNEGSETVNPNILKIGKDNYEDERAKFCLQEIEKVSHLMFEFDHVEQVKNKTQKGLEESLKIDFPHPPTQNRKFLEAFYVNEERLNKLFPDK